MRIVSLIDKKDVIERILRRLGLWQDGVRVHCPLSSLCARWKLAFGFQLPAKAPDGQERFPISRGDLTVLSGMLAVMSTCRTKVTRAMGVPTLPDSVAGVPIVITESLGKDDA